MKNTLIPSIDLKDGNPRCPQAHGGEDAQTEKRHLP